MTTSPDSSKPKLMDQVRAIIRLRGMSYRTEQTYGNWISAFSIYHLLFPVLTDFVAGAISPAPAGRNI